MTTIKNTSMIFLLVLLTACHPAATNSVDELTVAIEKYPEQTDPRLATDGYSQKVNQLVFSGLMRVSQNLEMAPELAQSYQITSPTTYVFTLKPGLRFHDGSHLSSKDVKATYLSMMAKDTRSPFAGSLSIIKDIQTPDEHTVIFELTKPNSPFLTLMALGILPQAYTQKKTKHPIGAGPYKREPSDSSQNQTRVTLKRFENYHAGPAAMPVITFRVIQDSTLRALELIKGRIDMIQNGIPYVLTPKLKQEDSLQFFKASGINFTYLAFQLKHPQLKNKTVRQAMALAINRKRLIAYKLEGMAQKADSLMSPKHWAYNSNLKNLVFNPELAKTLLDQAGLTDPDGDGPKTRFDLVYKTSSVKERVEIAELIAEDLKNIGIGVTVKSYEFGTFYRDIRQGDFDIYTLTWVGLTDPDIYHYTFHSQSLPPKGANRGHYLNPKLDSLIDQARNTTNKKHLTKLYQNIQQIVYKDFVYVPLWYEDNFAFLQKGITGYKVWPNASYLGVLKVKK